MNILQDLKQNQFHQPARMSKSSSTNNTKKITSSKSGNSYELQIQIGITYNEVLQAIKQGGLNRQFKLPEDGIKSLEKLNLLKKTVQFLVGRAKNSPQNGNNIQSKNCQQNSAMNESNLITCIDCQNYENNLQKLENQVRQHIRLEQQLKIYQESMEEKIQENKKEKSQFDKKYDELKKKYDEQKHSSSGNNQKIHKLEFENEKLKTEIKNLKQTPFQSSKRIKGYESRQKQNKVHEKQNRIDWAHRVGSMNKKDDKQILKQKISTNHTQRIMAGDKATDRTDRKSMQKRGDSSDRWRMSGARSTKLMNFNQKIIQQKNKQQRKKAIQSKFEYRR